MSTTATHTVPVDGIGPVEVTIAEYGSGQPFLLLHGGAGPASVTGFAELLTATHDVRVLVPTHPGFGGTPRPDALGSIPGLATLYSTLLDQLDLPDVTVIGNSIGGWITAEIALLKSPRVSGIVLIDAVGIEVPGHPVADFFSLTMDEVFQRSFHDPGPFRTDPATLPPAAQAIAAGNRAAISVYAGAAMADPTLLERLGSIAIPALVLWGRSDGIVDIDYGRAYAAAIPMARFQLLPDTGHSPQLETPDQVIHAIWDSSANRRQGTRQGEAMATFARSENLRGAKFIGADLRGARFIESDLSEVVMRGVQVEGADIDAPWLSDGDSFLRVNGVDVIPFVEAELNRRFPGRADRGAGDTDGLRAAWAALEHAWAPTLARVETMPAGTADLSVGGEWSFAQTLRHLVLATDMWLGRAILEIEQPFHPIGLTDTGTEERGLDTTIFATATPSYAEVLEARAGRVAMVRDFLATATPDILAATRKNPHDHEGQETTLSCLHVILEEEWEHLRYAVRDLDAIETKGYEMTGDASTGARLLGTLGTAAGKGVVRVQDRFDADIETVWSALTDPSRLASWWGEVEGDLRLGGEYRERVFASGWEGTGRIEACEAPRRLRVLHREPDQCEDQSIEVTLAAGGGQTTVVWEERGMPVAYLAGYGAGIQVHIEDLGAYLAGRERCDAGARMGELFPAYEPLAAKVSVT